MDHPTEMQEQMDHHANLAAMQRTARERLADGSFAIHPARDERAQPEEGIGGA